MAKHLFPLLLLCFFIVTGCSPSKLLAVAGQSDNYQLVSSPSYGDHPRQIMDIFTPRQPAASRCAVVFFYGGSWQSGDRADYHFVAQGLVKTGCHVAIADYRLYPEISYPAFVEDSAAAFIWLRKNAATYGINPENIYLAGHSAGAYNAAMVALHPRFMSAAGGKPDDIRGVIGLAGPYDFLPFTSKNIIKLFSTVPDNQTQPVNYVSDKAPPFLLLTGTDDTKVLPKNSASLARALEAENRSVTIKTYPKVGHTGIALSLSPVFAGKTSALADITAFIRATEEN